MKGFKGPIKTKEVGWGWGTILQSYICLTKKNYNCNLVPVRSHGDLKKKLY